MKYTAPISLYDQLRSLTRFILLDNIIENFDIVGIQQLGEELHIHLDEQLIYPTGYNCELISSFKWIYSILQIHDFFIHN